MNGSAPPAARTRVFVISLADATERREAFCRHADGYPVAWTFFDAHRAVGSHLVHDPGREMRCHGRTLEPAELGCYSSHSALWLQLQTDTDADQYIVIEDDMLVDWSALATISAHDFAAAGHHYVRLYGRKPSRFIMLVSNYLPGPRALLAFTGKPFGTQAYVITRQGAERMLRACRNIRRPLDDEMDRFWDHGIPNLTLFPFPVIERLAPSTIGESRFGGGIKRRRPRVARWLDDWRRAMAGLRYRLSRRHLSRP